MIRLILIVGMVIGAYYMAESAVENIKVLKQTQIERLNQI